jgi:hypothetical protein
LAGPSVADPLVGVERPRGDPGALTALGARYEAGSVSLTASARRLAGAVARVLGQAWSGQAAASCAASCLRSAQAVLVAGQAYGTAAGALRQHGARLAVSQAEWDAARRLADEAIAEERAHHQAAATAVLDPAAALGATSFGDLLWQSPLRAVARARAEQAVADAAASARQAATVLDGTLAPFRPPAPAPVHQESHWYDQVTGFASGVWDGVKDPAVMIGGLVGLHGDVSDNWAALGSGLWHGITDPIDFGKAVIGWDDLSQGHYGHWAGELAPTVVAAFFSGGAAAGVKGADAAAAATRTGEALTTAATVAKGLPAALKDIRVLMAETPEGLRLPAGLDATSLRTLMSEAKDGARGGSLSTTAWLGDADLSKIPAEWGPGRPNSKGIGTRWEDPTDQGNGVRIDKGNPGHKWETQRVDHVIVRHRGKVIGRDGRPVEGAIDEDPISSHIPLSEWLRWTEWWRP